MAYMWRQEITSIIKKFIFQTHTALPRGKGPSESNGIFKKQNDI